MFLIAFCEKRKRPPVAWVSFEKVPPVPFTYDGRASIYRHLPPLPAIEFRIIGYCLTGKKEAHIHVYTIKLDECLEICMKREETKGCWKSIEIMESHDSV